MDIGRDNFQAVEVIRIPDWTFWTVVRIVSPLPPN